MEFLCFRYCLSNEETDEERNSLLEAKIEIE